jgi:flagellar biosynthesis regulator FlaF
MGEIFQMFLTSQGVTNILLTLIVAAICFFIIFRKGIIHQLVKEGGLATQADMADLRREWKADMKDLRREMNDLRKELKEEIKSLRLDIESIKGNDLFHICMAILLHAQGTVKDKERFERIKDMLKEATPENKRSQLEAITFPDDNIGYGV